MCVGSVWLSWEYLKPGFIAQLKETAPKLQKLSLLRLTTSMATGAVYLAAKDINVDLPRNYTDNYKIFFTYDHDQT